MWVFDLQKNIYLLFVCVHVGRGGEGVSFGCRPAIQAKVQLIVLHRKPVLCSLPKTSRITVIPQDRNSSRGPPGRTTFCLACWGAHFFGRPGEAPRKLLLCGPAGRVVHIYLGGLENHLESGCYAAWRAIRVFCTPRRIHCSAPPHLPLLMGGHHPGDWYLLSQLTAWGHKFKTC